MYFDFDANEGYWGGQARTIADFDVVNGDSYGLLWGSLGIPTGGTGLTLMVETTYPETFNTGSDTNDVLNLRRSSTDNTVMRVLEANGRIAQAGPSGSKSVGGAGPGITRNVMSRAVGEDTYYVGSVSQPASMGITNTGSSHLLDHYLIHINGRPSTDPSVFYQYNTTGVLVKRVAIWASTLSNEELVQTSRFGRPGFYISGDSFVANGDYGERIRAEVLARGRGNVGTYDDGVGSIGLTQHVIRHTANPALWGDNLVIIDGGFEIDDGLEAAKTALDTYLSNIGHDRWVFLEPNPLNGVGDSRRDDWEAFFYGTGGLYEYIGPDHYIFTLDTMLANGDGSTTDNDRIALRQWPMNVTYDGTHPNELGRALETGLIVDYAIANKWV